jgi:hypothetical protein
MVRLDLAGMSSKDANRKLKELIKTEESVRVLLPSMAVQGSTQADFWKAPHCL